MMSCCLYIIKDYILSRKVTTIAWSVVAPVVVKITHQLSGKVAGSHQYTLAMLYSTY